MNTRIRCEGFPANAMVASFVLEILQQRGVLRRTALAETIRRLAGNIPDHLAGEQRVASLSALCAMLDDPNAERVTLRDWFKS